MGAISMPQGKGSFMHNDRDYDENEFPENIDRSRSNENIIYRHCESLDKAYKEIFGEAIQEYNEKQKRADRKIKNYLTQIENSKNGEKAFYEDVLQWGKKSDFIEHPEWREVARDCLLEYISTFEERNPNLKLIGAYIHMDEASPHLHFDYVPVADGYKSGLSLRNSLTKAMNAMGYGLDVSRISKKDNATSQWKNAERSYFASICQSRGLVVDPERHNEQEQDYDVREYKEIIRKAEQKAEQILNRADEVAKQQIKHAFMENNRLRTQNDKLYSELQELEETKTNKEKEIDELDNKIVLRQETISDLEKDILNKKYDLKDYETSIEAKEIYIKELSISVSELSAEIKEKKEEIISLDNQIEENKNLVTDTEIEIRQKEMKLENIISDVSTMENKKTELQGDIDSLKTEKKDLESLITALNANIDKFFSKLIGAFRKGLSEARELALKGVEPDAPKKAVERVNKVEEKATTSLDSMKTDRVSVKAKLEEKKAEVKENVKAEASAERDTIQQIARRRRGR